MRTFDFRGIPQSQSEQAEEGATQASLERGEPAKPTSHAFNPLHFTEAEKRAPLLKDGLVRELVLPRSEARRAEQRAK